VNDRLEDIITQVQSLPVGLKVFITALIAMTPVAELRAAIPAGAAMGLSVWTCAAVSIAGNMLPIPFILLFLRRVMSWMRRHSARMERVVSKLERRARAKSDILRKGEALGLLLFVAIPLPGTGAWTGALIAAVLGLRLKTAVPAISIGVLVAGIVITGITHGFKSLIS
jgi:uncharacterized membrane protein